MKIYIDPDKAIWPELTERVTADDAVIAQRVETILTRVREKGDKALLELAYEIDKADLSSGIEVTQEEIDEACAGVPAELKAAVERGINVVCSDQPADTLRLLRALGYHD